MIHTTVVRRDGSAAKGQGKRRAVLFIVFAIRPVGILIRAAGLWALDKFLPFSQIPYSADPEAAYHTRRFVRQALETVNGVCSAIFWVGFIVIAYLFISKSASVPFYKLFAPFIASAAAMFACAAPFILLDNASWGDYLFPIWSALAIMGIMLAVLFVANGMKRLKGR